MKLKEHVPMWCAKYKYLDQSLVSEHSFKTQISLQLKTHKINYMENMCRVVL